MLVNTTDMFEAIFLYRSIPVTTSPETVAQIVLSILINYPILHYYCYNRQYYHASSDSEVNKVRATLAGTGRKPWRNIPLLRDSHLLVG